MASKDLKPKNHGAQAREPSTLKGPAKPSQPGLRLGTKTTEMKSPTLTPRWGANVQPKPVVKTEPFVVRPVVRAGETINTGLSSERTRARMVDRLMQQGIRDPIVLEAMRQVPRHQFVDEALASRAYEDTALPIGHQQTISQPYVVARSIEIALGFFAADTPRPRRALEVGAGCGYQAAVMSYCFHRVVSVERIKNLADLAKLNLKPLRRSNLKVLFGDGLVVAAAEGPFDAILFSAGMADLPQEMLSLLAVGGVLVAPVGEPEQHLVAVQKTDQQKLKTQTFDMVRYVPVLRGTE